MPDRILENRTVQIVSTAIVALAAINVGATGLVETNLLVDVLELSGDRLQAAQGVIGAAGLLEGYRAFDEVTED